MASIKANPAVMRDKASSLKTIAKQINTITDEMSKEINNLKANWEGTGYETTVRKFNELKDDFQERYDTINAYSTYLENAAAEQEQTNEAVVQSAESRPS